MLVVPRGDGIRVVYRADAIDIFAKYVGFVFSWVVFLPAAVIFSGMFLAAIIPMKGVKKTLFKIPLVIFKLEAHNDEVVLGFTAFLLVFAFVAFTGGETFYRYTATQFGMDPGQFHTLCFSSALFTLGLSATLWLLSQFRRLPEIEQELEVKRLMDDIRQATTRASSDATLDDAAPHDKAAEASPSRADTKKGDRDER